jgi:hypothetical protein
MVRLVEIFDWIKRDLIRIALVLVGLLLIVYGILWLLGPTIGDMFDCIPHHCIGQFRVIVEGDLPEDYSIRLRQGWFGEFADVLVECHDFTIVSGKPSAFIDGVNVLSFGSIPYVACTGNGITITHSGYKPNSVRITVTWDGGEIDQRVHATYEQDLACCWSTTIKVNPSESGE